MGSNDRRGYIAAAGANPMIINSSQVRGVGKLVDLSVSVRAKESDKLFVLRETAPPVLDVSARCGVRTRGAALLAVEGMGPKSLQLKVEHDNKLRSGCERCVLVIGSVVTRVSC